MKTYIITGFLLFSFVFTNAESTEYKEAMKAALKIHDDAQSAIEEVKALEAFEMHAVDYLLKPFSNERFFAIRNLGTSLMSYLYCHSGLSHFKETNRNPKNFSKTQYFIVT